MDDLANWYEVLEQELGTRIKRRLDGSVRNVDNLMADDSTKMSVVLLGYFEAD